MGGITPASFEHPPSSGTWFAPQLVGAHTSAAPGANLLMYAQIVIPQRATLTGIGYWVGGTANGNVKVGLYDSAGTKVAEQTGNVVQATSATYQKVPFDGVYSAAPGVYFVALILSSATGTRYGTSGPAAPSGSAVQGDHSCPASITVPTVPVLIVPNVSTY